MIKEIELPLVSNEDEVCSYYDEVNTNIGTFKLEQEIFGSHIYYRWLAHIKEEVSFKGMMDIPSVRLHFVTQTCKGMCVEIDGQACVLQANTYNIFFGKEPCYGKDFLQKSDTIEVITIVITAQQFALMAAQYPEVFGSYYERYERSGNFVLSAERSIASTFALQTVLAQLQQSALLGKAAHPYADLKVQELFLLQVEQLEALPKTYSYCKTPRDIEKMHEVRHLITADLQASLSISELARSVGVNEKKLCYGFKEVFGTTVFGYLYDYKMLLAQQLLQEGSKTVSEVALACGYEYVSHFSRAFKKKFGVVPLAVKR